MLNLILVFFFINSLLHSHETRNCDLLRTNQCSFYTTTTNSPYELGFKLYNMLPQSFIILRKPDFLNRLKRSLFNLCIYNVEELFTHCAAGES